MSFERLGWYCLMKTPNTAGMPFGLLLGVDFLQEAIGVSPLVHQVEHVAHIDTDAACKLAVEVDVRSQAIPVAIEGETDELALAVEDR